jgi:hypothetical protein
MAGKIIADTLEHSTAGSVTTDYVVNGSAKAWIDIPSGAASINDSFNVSSLDDDATGAFGVNVTNSFSNAFHAPTTGVENTSSTGLFNCVIESKTTSAIEGSTMYVTASVNRTLFDRDAHIASHGDLA